jgi:hypothetical protein
MKAVLTFSSSLLVIGSVMLFTLWFSNFADFMHLEDLALEYTPAAEALREVTPGERFFLIGSLGLIALGLLLKLSAWIAKLSKSRN